MSQHRGPSATLWALILALLIAAVSLLLLLNFDYDLVPFLRVPDDNGYVRAALAAIVVISVVWISLLISGKVFERTVRSQVQSHAQARSIWRLISYVVWCLVLLALALGLMGDVTSTALSVGLLGAALAFVLQKPLLNIAGWVVITYRRLYRIGDRVALGGVQGYVTDIQVMSTEVREFGEWMGGDTFTGRIVNLPNLLVFDGPVHNYTRDVPFVWDEVVTLVTFESDIDVAKAYMKEAADEIVGTLMSANYEEYRSRLEIRDLDALLLREPEVRMDFSDSGVDISVLYFCPAEQRRRVKGDIVERVWRKFTTDPRVEIAYPHLKLIREARPARGPATVTVPTTDL
jgi:small-conductance mechanosensitive channel